MKDELAANQKDKEESGTGFEKAKTDWNVEMDKIKKRANEAQQINIDKIHSLDERLAAKEDHVQFLKTKLVEASEQHTKKKTSLK